MSLSVFEVIRLLKLPEKANLALTGGGGKTTFLGVFGQAFKSLGMPVLLTTTTKVQNPFPVETDWFVASSDPEERKKLILDRWKPGTLGLVVAGPFGDHKWEGLSPEWVDDLFAAVEKGIILNEADGALRLPIKAPAEHEPIIPSSSTHVIPILGLSALGSPLDKAHAFRPHLIAEITGLSLGDTIDETAMARLLTNPRGLAKGSPDGAEVIPFLNQADTPDLETVGKRVAEEILTMSDRVKAVLTGMLKSVPSFDLVGRELC